MVPLHVQLTKCLGACKEGVDSINPKHVRPNIDKLKDAVNNSRFVAELLRTRRLFDQAVNILTQLTYLTEHWWSR